jgi:ABC-2 type transport system ATP-binding protein
VPATISVRDLRKAYGRVKAVDGVSFDVQHGEFFGILGPNGAGKTTTLEIVEGLRQADGGTVSVLGRAPWPRNPALLPRIGVQLQASSFFERLTAREQLRTFAMLYGVPARRADAMLGVVGLEDQAGTRTEKLSGGQRSGCRSRARWCTTRRCCSSTSRPGRWTRRPGGTCGTCCGRSAPRGGPSC